MKESKCGDRALLIPKLCQSGNWLLGAGSQVDVIASSFTPVLTSLTVCVMSCGPSLACGGCLSDVLQFIGYLTIVAYPYDGISFQLLISFLTMGV